MNRRVERKQWILFDIFKDFLFNPFPKRKQSSHPWVSFRPQSGRCFDVGQRCCIICWGWGCLVGCNGGGGRGVRKLAEATRCPPADQCLTLMLFRQLICAELNKRESVNEKIYEIVGRCNLKMQLQILIDLLLCEENQNFPLFLLTRHSSGSMWSRWNQYSVCVALMFTILFSPKYCFERFFDIQRYLITPPMFPLFIP